MTCFTLKNFSMTEDQKQPIYTAKGISFDASHLAVIHCTEKEDMLPVLKAILLADARSLEHIGVRTD